MHSALPPVLYHYTTAQGLLGILESGCIWATNSRFLNDPTEIEYAIRLFRAVAEDEFAKYDPSRVRTFREWVTFWLNYYEKEAKVYVACFCEKGDLLSQWRGYGASGGGYAIGVATGHLRHRDIAAPTEASLAAITQDFIVRKVIYEKDTQERLIRERIARICNAGKSAKSDKESTTNSAWNSFAAFFSECLNCFKHPAFEQEQEWRAIQFGRAGGRDRPDLKFYFRTSGGRIIDYTKLDVRAGSSKYQGMIPICVMRYGPTLEPRTTERSLQILLGAHGYSAELVQIERSSVPLTG